MPEVAEVRRFVDQLTKEYGGKTLTSMKLVGGRFLKENAGNSNGAGIFTLKFPLVDTQFDAKGKFIYWSLKEEPLNNKRVYFFITLGMSGSFGKQNKHSAIEFNFDGKDPLYFNDIRHFGTFKIVFDSSDLSKKLNDLGWDPLQQPNFSQGLIAQLRNFNHKTIAEVLMNQKVFAGVGNYIRSEALYRAEIKPDRKISAMTDKEIETLCNAIIDVVKEAYACGGATIATYSDLYGNVGTFYDQFKVYGRKKDPLGNKVIKAKAADGRTVHYVESIQK
jgi:formamidopyrimidine-DNA glycosylase